MKETPTAAIEGGPHFYYPLSYHVFPASQIFGPARPLSVRPILRSVDYCRRTLPKT